MTHVKVPPINLYSYKAAMAIALWIAPMQLKPSGGKAQP